MALPLRDKPMNIIKTGIPGALIIEPKTFVDRRGSFPELYQADCYATGGIGHRFVQDLSRSTKGILRGLHFQNRNREANW